MKLSDIFTYNISPGELFNIPHQPLNVFLDLTTQCNNKCLFCYNSEPSIENNAKAEPNKIFKIIELLGKTGTKEILYLGGEPFAFPFIIKALSIGKEYDISQRAITNGSYLKDVNYCQDLIDAGLNEVGVSFHSSKEKIHDKLAGRGGAYSDAITALENCIETGIDVFIQYSPNQLNDKDDVMLFAAFLRKEYGNGINLFDINRLLPIGQGKKAENIILGEKHWFEFLVTLTGLIDFGFDVRAELTPFCWIEEMAAINCIEKKTVEKIFSINRGCYMWIAQLPLDCNGNIKFCPAGEKVGPCILEVDWPNFWKKNELFQGYRKFEWNKKCIDFDEQTSCEFFYKCLGGCKYSAGNSYQIDKLSTCSLEIINGI